MNGELFEDIFTVYIFHIIIKTFTSASSLQIHVRDVRNFTAMISHTTELSTNKWPKGCKSSVDGGHIKMISDVKSIDSAGFKGALQCLHLVSLLKLYKVCTKAVREM